MRVGVLTGGGDCPGLNAVIRAVVRKGEVVYRDEFVGYADGLAGGHRGPDPAARQPAVPGDPSSRRHDPRHLARAARTARTGEWRRR